MSESKADKCARVLYEGMIYGAPLEPFNDKDVITAIRHGYECGRREALEQVANMIEAEVWDDEGYGEWMMGRIRALAKGESGGEKDSRGEA